MKTPEKWLNDPQNEEWLDITINLLHAEHRAMVRLVKKVKFLEGGERGTKFLTDEWRGEWRGYLRACDDILAALTQRVKP